MPNISKKNAGSTVGTILAEGFNLHTDEIIAIEQFLGLEAATEADVNDLLGGRVDPQNIIGILRLLSETTNLFSEGVLATSGQVHNGQRMIFPEGATTTFLQKTPAATDRIIEVVSTIGFPDSGVISILNDLDVPAAGSENKTTVEIIRYGGKSSTQFMNCERGVDGTTTGPHSGAFLPLNTASPGTSNLLDQCRTLPMGLKICNRRYPGWRFRVRFFFPAFGLVGTYVEIVRAIRRDPLAFSLSQSALGVNFDEIIAIASNLEILQTVGGIMILRSRDAAKIAQEQLTWVEAAGFVDALIEASIVVQLNQPANWKVGPTPFIPVFQGRMDVQHSVAAVSLNPTAASSGTTTTTTTTTTTPGTTTTPVPIGAPPTVSSARFYGTPSSFSNSDQISPFKIIGASYQGRQYNLALPSGNTHIAIARIEGTNFGDVVTQQIQFARPGVGAGFISSSNSEPIDNIVSTSSGFSPALDNRLENTSTTRWVIIRDPGDGYFSGSVLAGDTVRVLFLNANGISNALLVPTSLLAASPQNLAPVVTITPTSPPIIVPPPAPVVAAQVIEFPEFIAPAKLQADPIASDNIWFNTTSSTANPFAFKTYQYNGGTFINGTQTSPVIFTHIAGHGQFPSYGLNVPAIFCGLQNPWLCPVRSTPTSDYDLYLTHEFVATKIDTALKLQHVAGNLQGTTTTFNTPAPLARFTSPVAIAVTNPIDNVARQVTGLIGDSDGKMYAIGYAVGDPVYRISPVTITSVPAGFDASTFRPIQLRLGPAGTTLGGNFFALSNNRIWKITLQLGPSSDNVNIASATLTPYAGTGTSGNTGNDGPAISANLTPVWYCFDALGNMYVNSLIGSSLRKIDVSSGIISDFPIKLNEASDTPYSFCFDASRNLYYTEFVKNKIVRVRPPYTTTSEIIVRKTPPVVVTPTTPPSTTTTTTTNGSTTTTTTTTTNPTTPVTVPLTPATTPPTFLSSIATQQTADGRLFIKIASDQVQNKTDQAIIQYEAFFTPSFRTKKQKDAF